MSYQMFFFVQVYHSVTTQMLVFSRYLTYPTKILLFMGPGLFLLARKKSRSSILIDLPAHASNCLSALCLTRKKNRQHSIYTKKRKSDYRRHDFVVSRNTLNIFYCRNVFIYSCGITSTISIFSFFSNSVCTLFLDTLR